MLSNNCIIETNTSHHFKNLSQEGHFIERSWTGLLSLPLSSNEIIVLKGLSTDFVDTYMDGYGGQMILADD